MANVPSRPKGQEQKVAGPRRGEIYLCSFDPTIGHEIKKTRPALVYSGPRISDQAIS
jgi:mRNA interferase MazF